MQCLLLYTRYLQVGVQLGPRFDNTVAAIIDVCRPLWEKVQLPEESLIPYDAVVMRYSAEVSPRIPTHVDDCKATLNICLQTAEQGGGLKFFLPEANWSTTPCLYHSISTLVIARLTTILSLPLVFSLSRICLTRWLALQVSDTQTFGRDWNCSSW